MKILFSTLFLIATSYCFGQKLNYSGATYTSNDTTLKDRYSDDSGTLDIQIANSRILKTTKGVNVTSIWKILKARNINEHVTEYQLESMNSRGEYQHFSATYDSFYLKFITKTDYGSIIFRIEP
jgi:hypothetical protein